MLGVHAEWADDRSGQRGGQRRPGLRYFFDRRSPGVGGLSAVAQQAAAKQATTAKASKVEATAAPAPATNAQIQELPKTGGGAILLWGLGASILLVASGLLSRRIIR